MSSHKPSQQRTLSNRADMADEKIGVLIANLGTPDATDYWSVRRYLSEFLSDQRVIDIPRWKWQPLLQLVILSKRPFSSGRAYDKIWNTDLDESPLLTITREQAEKLSSALTASLGDRIKVAFCMRYGTPSTMSQLKKLIAAGCRKILFFPLYPQYSGAASATANDQFFRALMAEKWQPAARTAAAYFDNPAYIEALADTVDAAYGGSKTRPEVLIASYHGMPQRYLDQGDPYYHQCIETTRLLREKLGWTNAQIIPAFQSRFGLDEWLKPYTVDEVTRLAKSGVKHIAVIAPAFSADCLETLEEVQTEIRLEFESAGGEQFTYIPCLNADDSHISVLKNIVLDNLGGWI